MQSLMVRHQGVVWSPDCIDFEIHRRTVAWSQGLWCIVRLCYVHDISLISGSGESASGADRTSKSNETADVSTPLL